MSTKIKVVLLLFSMAVLLGITWYIYQPGLKGGFLLDDQASLALLKIIDNEPTAEHLYDYFSASKTGILKRPISVFSFLIDAQNWPAEPYSFKKTNLIIHLINGALLYLLIYYLFIIKTKSFWHSLSVSFLATAFWLLNPFLVSTTLYVVQRMAMLPASFTLLGLLLYMYLRHRYQNKQSILIVTLLVVNVGVFSLLAALSKENGVLYVFLMALFEFIICQKWLAYRPLQKSAQWMVIWVPVISLIVIIVLMIPGAIEGYDFRAFTMYERSLTQFRVLSQYLFHLFVPDYFTEGVFTDGFVISKGLFDPITTIPSIIFIFSLVLLLWKVRKVNQWFTFSVLFFFVAHILESSIFPLEMYFEHRNYLSSMFIFVPLSLFLMVLFKQTKIYGLVVLTLLGMWITTTQQRVNIWGNEIFLLDESMKLFPESVRARTLNAILYDKSGLKSDALKIIEEGLKLNNSLELRINAILLRCVMNTLNKNHVEGLILAFKSEPFDKDDLNPMAALMRNMFKSSCEYQFSNKEIKELLEAFEANPVTEKKSGQSWVDFYWGQFYLFKLNKPDLAYEKYLSAFYAMPNITILFDAIYDLLNHEEFGLAKELFKLAYSEYNHQYQYKPDWQKHGEELKQIAEKVNNEEGNK